MSLLGLILFFIAVLLLAACVKMLVQKQSSANLVNQLNQSAYSPSQTPPPTTTREIQLQHAANTR